MALRTSMALKKRPRAIGSVPLSDLDQRRCHGFQLSFYGMLKGSLPRSLRAFFNVQREDALGRVSALYAAQGRFFAFFAPGHPFSFHQAL
jgi:hypothetical protein